MNNIKNKIIYAGGVLTLALSFIMTLSYGQHYKIVGTNQTKMFDDETDISSVNEGDRFYGQNANYSGNVPQYQDNGDGTISDLVSGLMWQKSCDFNNDGVINVFDKMSYDEALAGADTFSLAGYSDWRLPSIKEAYSLILFSGVDPSGYEGTDTDDLTPFMNDEVFEFGYGDTENDERIIDAQFASTTKYVHYTMNGDETMFGVNLADGRIKGYPIGAMPGQTEDKQFYVMYCRENTNYGINDFIENSNGTISDKATGLMWMKTDNADGMTWEEALAYAEGFEYGGYSDWRLPDAKELQSIVDYTRSPETSNSAAIDPVFECTPLTIEDGASDYAYYWTSTTHESWASDRNGMNAVYLSFGRAMGYMQNSWIDVHGAGAQRSDPKMGDPGDYPTGHGPQGDAIRINNFVRLVRYDNGMTSYNQEATQRQLAVYPNPSKGMVNISLQHAGAEVYTVQIINAVGQVVLNKSNAVVNTLSLNVDDLESGIYFLKVTRANKEYSQKIIIE